MKTILLLGGMTPDVTALYYNTINTAVRAQLGNRTAAPLYMYSANLEDMIQHAIKGDWSSFAATYEEPIKLLGKKVDGVAICAILAHKVAARLSDVATASSVPFLHITDFLATHIKTTHPGARRLGLLGPKISMLDSEDPDFFIGRLQSSSCGFQVIVPETEQDIEEVNRGMLEEVAKGVSFVTTSTKTMFIDQAKKLIASGAQVIILGSTDLGFVLKQEDLGDVPVIEPAGRFTIDLTVFGPIPSDEFALAATALKPQSIENVDVFQRQRLAQTLTRYSNAPGVQAEFQELGRVVVGGLVPFFRRSQSSYQIAHEWVGIYVKKMVRDIQPKVIARDTPL